MSSTLPTSGAPSITPSPPPTSTTSAPPRRCRSRRAELTSSISAITTSPSLAKLGALGCRLGTRFKANAPLNAPRDLTLEPGTTVLSDRIGFLPARQAMNRKNPMQDPVREIVVKTETGETLRLMTNDLDAPAQEIADLYKRRWRVELFFRVMKQTLKITRFVGRSENAVRIQIAVAPIAYLLLRALQQ